MTVAHSSTEPPADSLTGGSGLRAITEDIRRFEHPLTRMLLANDGYTTPALEAIVSSELHVLVLRQTDVAARWLPAVVASALRVSDTDCALVRRSRLITSDLTTVSVNFVVAVREPAAASGVDDLHVPIGSGLATRGLTQRRQILHAGVRRWPDGRRCAARAYVMALGDRPICYIRESFNPDIVPSNYLPTRALSARGRPPDPACMCTTRAQPVASIRWP